MSWTSGAKQSLNMLCHGKYLFKSFETLQTEVARYYVKKLVAIVILSVPDPLNGFHNIKHNSSNH